MELADELLICVSAVLGGRLGIEVREAVGPWLKEADWVFSCVVGSKSLEVEELCLRHMKRGVSLADLTTAAPDKKLQASTQGRRIRRRSRHGCDCVARCEDLVIVFMGELRRSSSTSFTSQAALHVC